MTNQMLAEENGVVLLFLIPLIAELYLLHRWFYDSLDREKVKELRNGCTWFSFSIMIFPIAILVLASMLPAFLQIFLVPLVYVFIGGLYLWLQLIFVITGHPQSYFASEWKLDIDD